MKRGVGVIIAVLLLLVIGGVVVAPRWRLYPEGSTATKYPGSNQVVEEQGGEYLVDPKENGKPFFVAEEDAAQYSPELYTLTAIPAQTELLYAVGRVVKWEKIEGSSERYLVVKHASGQARYRVTERTALAIERVGAPWSKEPNKLEKLSKGLVEEMTEARLSRMILPGDAVTLLPVWELPELSKKDEQGEYLVSTIIMRRGIGL